ncbi:MAG: DNA synthesis and replication; recombination and DNA repair [Olavius algarvensis Delta 4 endosymbiont]|nr:MAG: DNA synthesis and replication; recombination and DNA repair [Olavius algarvensis Delta 4 endosymbiont]
MSIRTEQTGIIAAFDVYYQKDGRSSAVAVGVNEYADAQPVRVYSSRRPNAEPYVPGEFYRRELPCILELLKTFPVAPREIIVDGYVMLGAKPGLGQHLFMALGGCLPVIGVAKSAFKSAGGLPVFRGRSSRPLYITAVGMHVDIAAANIRKMHGHHRIPTLLKLVDRLARENAGGKRV